MSRASITPIALPAGPEGELHTITGSPNTIRGVDDRNALVATGRSATGQPVPIAEVQKALDLLTADGTVTCTPPVVGYRSAFIGAVLRPLPGTVVTENPPAVVRRRNARRPLDRSSPQATQHRHDDEKRDLRNIGMLAGKPGCDVRYELGYISVDDAGTILTTPPDANHLGNTWRA